LLRAGAPTTETTIGLAWLKTREEHWAQVNREVDLALVLEAIQLGDDYQTVYPKVLDLLEWAHDQLRHPTRHKSESVPEESLRAPFVAAQLASFVWATVIREYKALFQALIKTDQPDQAAGVLSARISAPTRSAEETADDGDGLVEPRPSLGKWQRAVQQLEGRLLSHVQSRDNIVRHTRHGGAPEVHAQMEHYRGLLQRCQALADQIKERTAPAVLVELNNMGTDVCGRAWPDLDVPGGEE
jgi:hypothetical protein